MGGKGWGVGTQLVETVRTIMVQQNLLHPLDGEKKENLFGLGILGSLQCHHPYIKGMIAIYEGKPKIKMKEKTLCILSYSFFYFCHVVAAARAVVLFSVTDGVSLCAFSSPVHTKTLPVSLTCSSCNLALLLKVCVRFFKDMCGISVLWYK